MGVYLYPNNTETELKNAYIGEYRVPGANTVAYYPLTADTQLQDKSGNSYNLSKNGSGSTTFGTYGGVDCLYIANNAMLYASIGGVSASGGITSNIWYCPYQTPQYDNATVIGFNNTSNVNDNDNKCVDILHCNGRPSSRYGITGYVDDGSNSITSSYSVNTGQWYNLCFTYKGTTGILYVNGNLIGTVSKADAYDTKNYIRISKRTKDFDRSIRGYVSEAIFENKERTAQQVANYYNSTKSNYGL